MYKDLSICIENAKNHPSLDNIESDPTTLKICYHKLNIHFNELYELVRDNYSFIVKKESMQGVDEKRFIEIMGGILSEAGNAKDVLKNIIKAK